MRHLLALSIFGLAVAAVFAGCGTDNEKPFVCTGCLPDGSFCCQAESTH
jgi:hypothetical protein